nr:MAG TPA: hypothetical protein [Caudoviricetes sp.]
MNLSREFFLRLYAFLFSAFRVTGFISQVTRFCFANSFRAFLLILAFGMNLAIFSTCLSDGIIAESGIKINRRIFK